MNDARFVAPDAQIDAMVAAALRDYDEPNLAQLMEPVLTDLAVWLTRGDTAGLPKRTGLPQDRLDRAIERMRTAQSTCGGVT